MNKKEQESGIKMNIKILKELIIKNQKTEQSEQYIKSIKDERVYFPFLILEYIDNKNTTVKF